jgi:hypothetical protein
MHSYSGTIYDNSRQSGKFNNSRLVASIMRETSSQIRRHTVLKVDLSIETES